MIFRDNKSCDCGVNEVTAYKGREGSGSHHAAPPETGDRRISNSSYRRSSRHGTNCVTGIPFSQGPAAPSAILPDAIFPRRIISYSIANYRMLSGRRFLTRFDLSGMPWKELRTTFGNNQMILPFRTIIDFYFSLRRYLTFMNIAVFFKFAGNKVRTSQD